ncbi:hypothetical protein [Phyllobacterium zundukense]|uniref:HicB family protein n=1 Tax=Phyllobacterium zundukense TaxID=1867719 RepID=A0A2N9VYQ6_9HYPH|nr:hypothetical protein [Phyllobacterium zundukense]ATU95208.1 hypothetical protein BLM14_26085 [Phyllobacterium zundukense]PIO44624.1 hypothetical protein B5P45_12245 [Phyllobacterium zundukense]
MYRDYVCTLAKDAESGLFIGGVAGIDHGPTLSDENADALRTAIHHVVDTHLDVDAAPQEDGKIGEKHASPDPDQSR